MRKLIFLLISVFLITLQTSYSQITEHITWESSVVNVGANEATLVLKAKLDKGWHLYGRNFGEGGPNRLVISYTPAANYVLQGNIVEQPKPKEEMDEVFEIKVQYFEHEATFSQKIKFNTTTHFTVKSNIEGQICLTDGACIITEKDFVFEVKPFKATLETKSEFKTTSNQLDTSETTKIDTSKKAEISNQVTKSESSESSESSASLLLFFWIAILAGLAAINTPCVFPMIPLTVSFFLKEKNIVKAKINALLFGLSIIVIYVFLGTLFSFLLGPSFANSLSTHWIPNTLFFIIFLIFAASFFGVFEIVMPSWIINKVDKQADKGGFLGPFFIAFTLVLVSFSCTVQLVGGILVQSSNGQLIKPIIGMLGFSLAFAIPFTFFALFPTWLQKLPKSGGWLNSVKVVLGFIELALGLKFLSIADLNYHWHILDREVFLAIWIVITILLGFYLLGKLKFPHDSEVKNVTFTRLILAIATFSFAVYMIPGLWGAPLKALSGYIPPLTTQDFNIYQKNNQVSNITNSQLNDCEKPKYDEFLKLPHDLSGYFDWDQALACSKKTGKPVFVDFTGHGCANCRKMEENVWVDPRVLSILQNDFIILSLYVDDKTELPINEWMKTKDGKYKKTIGAINSYIQETRFKSNSQPHYVILNSNGEQLGNAKHFDLDIDRFVEFLETGKKLNYK